MHQALSLAKPQNLIFNLGSLNELVEYFPLLDGDRCNLMLVNVVVIEILDVTVLLLPLKFVGEISLVKLKVEREFNIFC